MIRDYGLEGHHTSKYVLVSLSTLAGASPARIAIHDSLVIRVAIRLAREDPGFHLLLRWPSHVKTYSSLEPSTACADCGVYPVETLSAAKLPAKRNEQES
jgi:hypothetical protein